MLVNPSLRDAILAPLLLYFKGNFLELERVWGVTDMAKGTTNITGSKLLDWGKTNPWEGGLQSGFAVWQRYYISDPTGLFRLGESGTGDKIHAVKKSDSVKEKPLEEIKKLSHFVSKY